MNVQAPARLLPRAWSQKQKPVTAGFASLAKIFHRGVGWSDGPPKSPFRRERVVILGSGWAGYVLSRKLDTRVYQPIVLSPRSYFVFTPLLNDAAVGTLEFQTTVEPVRRRGLGVDLVQGWAERVNFADKTVSYKRSVRDPNVSHCITGEHDTEKGQVGNARDSFPLSQVSYDKLVVAVGSSPQTFGTRGVNEHAMFLRDIGDARKVRRRVLEVFELASHETQSSQIRQYLLHFAIVGGGPTGIEFAAQLSDLIRQDMSKLYPDLVDLVRITLYDVASKVLPMFDASLADYAVESSRRQGIDIKTSHHVEGLRQGLPESDLGRERGKDAAGVKGGVYTLRTKEDGDIGIGLCVWATGNTATSFVREALRLEYDYPSRSVERHARDTGGPPGHESWKIQQDHPSGHIVIDQSLRVKLESQSGQQEGHLKDVWCIGDASHISSKPLPATAQVANQQAVWLAKHLNETAGTSNPRAESEKETVQGPAPTFEFVSQGVMTYVGDDKALFQRGDSGDSQRVHKPKTSDSKATTKATTQPRPRPTRLTGLPAFLLWRAAYISMTLSWRNRILVPVYWIITRLFGRDISRF